MKRLTLILLIAATLMGCKKIGCTKSVKCYEENSNMVIETILSRRSIRSYTDVVVEKEKMEKILWCGINAPNGQNLQSWEIRVINSKDKLKELVSLATKNDSSLADKFISSFRGATTLVFIAHDTNYKMSQIDCGLLGQNMMLAATSLGVGSIALGSPIMFLSNEAIKKEVREFFKLSSAYELLYCIGFGYANEEPEAKPRTKEKILFLE